jgi:DNA-binding MarR family transcriptional regulator
MDEPRWGMVGMSMGHALRRAQVVLSQEYGQTLKRLGLSTIQTGILELVAMNEGLSQKRISELILTDPSVVVGATAKLEAMKLVSRDRAARDRRNYVLRITEKGRKVRRDALAAIRRAETRFVDALSQSEAKHLLAMLHRLGRFGHFPPEGGY